MADPLAILLAATLQRSAVAWPALVTAIADIAPTPSPEAEQALVDLISSPEAIPLAGGYVPHSQSPIDMIRAAAIETLVNWTGDKHADVCRQAAAATGSPNVKRMVAARFGKTG
jgi:hypothetical protein